MKQKISLNGKWNCTGCSPEGEQIVIAGKVPGSVHKDLLDAGIIKVPYYRDNAEKYQWIDHWKWVYDKTFVLDEVDETMQICFEGLDVFCDIVLNGEALGTTANMFIAHHFPVGQLLEKGENHIQLTFYPPEDNVSDRPKRDGVFSWKRLYIRRIQGTHGWDSMNRCVTCGIIKGVYLYADSCTEIDNLYIYTDSVDDYSAQVRLDVNFKSVGEDTWLHTVITGPDQKIVFENKKLIVEKNMYQFIDIVDPKLWFPNGYGEQPLYQVHVEVLQRAQLQEKELVLSSKTLNLGIRTLKVLQRKDIEDSEYYQKCLAIKELIAPYNEIADFDKNREFYGFVVLVNDVPVMCKGADWVPCESFIFEGNEKKIKALLEMSAKAGLNMIRIWGGGVFEEDIFYDICDRLGILVQQDFMMACGIYPDDEEWFLEEMQQEAEFAVKKLCNHASLAWWNGDNENAGYASDDVKDYSGRKAVVGVITPIVYRYDRKRNMFPSSPFGGNLNTSLTSGITHNTMFEAFRFHHIISRDMDDYEDYQSMYLSRFNNEEPLAGAPALSSLRKFMTEEDIYGDDISIWQYHTKNHPSSYFREHCLFGHLKIMAEKILGQFKNKEDRLLKMQYLQYEFVCKSMELYRRNKWFSSGIIYWMLNDSWPASGWSLIDYYCVPKAGFYAFAESAKPVILSVEHKDGAYRIYVCNDSLKKACGTIRIQAENFKDKSHVWVCDFEVEANQSNVIMTIPEIEMQEYTDLSSVLLCSLQSDLGSYHTRHYITRPANVKYPEAKVRILSQTEEAITLVSDVYIPAVRLEGEYSFSDNYFAMMPGVEKTVQLELHDQELAVVKGYCADKKQEEMAAIEIMAL